MAGRITIKVLVLQLVLCFACVGGMFAAAPAYASEAYELSGNQVAPSGQEQNSQDSASVVQAEDSSSQVALLSSEPGNSQEVVKPEDQGSNQEALSSDVQPAEQASQQQEGQPADKERDQLDNQFANQTANQVVQPEQQTADQPDQPSAQSDQATQDDQAAQADQTAVQSDQSDQTEQPDQPSAQPDQPAAQATQPAKEAETSTPDKQVLAVVSTKADTATQQANANTTPTNWERLAGASALDTMKVISQEGFSSADAVVLANKDSFNDSLAASPLAGMLKAPILLTAQNALSAQAASELDRLGTTKVYVVGGNFVVSDAVVNSLKQRGYTVERIAGRNASQTADAIAKKIGTAAGDTCVVVTQASFQDALSIAPFAYAHVAPIFLADPAKGLSSASQKLINQGKYARTIIVGGTYVVPTSTEAQVKSAGVANVSRIAGQSAYDTSAAVAEWSKKEGMSYNAMAVATGQNHSDAVAGAALCGKNNSVLVLVDDVNRSATDKTYRKNIAQVAQGYVLGGRYVVSPVTWEYLHRPANASTIIPSEQTIADGLYLLTTAKNGSVVVEVPGGKTSNNANVALYGFNNSLAQKWQVTWTGRGYSLRNLATGRALAIQGGNTASGVNVVQTTFANNDAQLWAISQAPAGAWIVRNLKSGMALDIAGARTSNGTNVRVYIPNSTTAQQYKMKDTEVLVDGAVYTISLASNRKKVLDDPGSSTSSGTQMHLYASNNSPAQKFVARRISKNSYALQPLASGLYLQDSGGKVVQAARTSATSQQWTVALAHGGAMLTNKATGKALTLASGKTANGTKMVSSAASGDSSQRFVIGAVDPITSGTYVIKSMKGGRALNVSGSPFTSGSNITIWSATDGGEQAFTITKEGNYYRITNAQSNKAVAVAGASKSNSANVQQEDTSSSSSQLWRVEISKEGGIVFINKASGKALDIAGGRNANGTNVQQYASNGTPAQQWRLYQSSYKVDPALARAANSIAYASSATSYVACVDLTANKTFVFKGYRGNWTPVLATPCSTGAPYTPTVTGDFTVGMRGYSFGSGFTCYYWTQFYGDYLFHSTLYNQGTFVHQDPRLGLNISHGCVRLAIDDAYWIYTNVPSGTLVRIYY